MTAPAKRTGPVRLEVVRRFDDPVERVFDAWLDPAGVGRWLFATPGGAMERVELDPRVGGAFRVDERRGDTIARHFGTFLEIDRPRRLVFSFATDRETAPTVVTVEIEADGAGCVLTLSHEMDSAWTGFADRARQGWTTLLDGLSWTVADDRTMTLTRTVRAPRELVWQAWTDPAHLPNWWGPRGFSCRVDEIDIRPGGVWRFDMVGPEGVTFRNRLRYVELEPPVRLVLLTDDDGASDFRAFRTTVTFDPVGPVGDRTLITMRVMFDSAETRRAMAEFGAVDGGESTLDCLEERLAAMASDAIALVLTRTLDAPRELVWRAWTDPEHARHWGPDGFAIEYMEQAFVVGGRWRARLTPTDGGPVLWQGGVVREIVAPARLVYSFAWDRADGTRGTETLIDLTFEERDGRTRLTLRQTGFPDTAERDGHAVGWTAALASLARHAATQTS